jgi:hypothetical protein
MISMASVIYLLASVSQNTSYAGLAILVLPVEVGRKTGNVRVDRTGIYYPTNHIFDHVHNKSVT